MHDAATDAAVRFVRQRLREQADEGYRAFTAKLIPTVDPARIVGVRMPAVRALAKELARRGDGRDAARFMASAPHEFHEENLLHGVLISSLAVYEEAVAALDAFLPEVGNWAVCDCIVPRAFKRRPEGLVERAARWIASEREYPCRFGIGVLMNFYLDEGFSPEHLELAAGARPGAYYVDMMAAWYFATALAKQWDATLPVIEGRRLDPWTHNKAIQKAIESRRVPAERKAYLRTLKLPGPVRPAKNVAENAAVRT